MTLWLAALALVAGIAIGWFAHRAPSRPLPPGSEAFPADLRHVLDLLRRAHGAPMACLVQGSGETVTTSGGAELPRDVEERGAALARVALSDRRQHILRDALTLAAVGDGDRGVALAWPAGRPGEDLLDAALQDARRLLAGFHVHSLRTWERSGHAAPTGPEALDSLAFAICEAASAVTELPTAIVLRNDTNQAATIVAVSHGADRRLLRAVVSAASAAGRACMGDVPVVAATGEELIGQARSDRRRREDHGTAHPLHDGRRGIGALIVFGRPDELNAEAQRRLLDLTVDAGPRLAVAAAIRAAETRAETDELTGMWNRRALERAMQADRSKACALLLVDLDHFKQLNDSFGHAAGDAALRHVARAFRGALREQDLAARVGGEEFALWLPDTPLSQAREVAERVRTAVHASKLYWAGAELTLSCSVGLAGYPDTVGQSTNLYSAADAALYRAKERGRNRVEVALPSA